MKPINGSYVSACCIILLLILIALLPSGCLQTEQATPALIPDEVLQGTGWVQVGDASYEDIDQQIAGINVSISMASVVYGDEKLRNEILDSARAQAEEIDKSLATNINSIIDEFDNQDFAGIRTVRVMLPAGITIPNALLDNIIDKQIQTFVTELGIQEFHLAGEESFTTSSGEEATLKTYRGHIENNVVSNIEVLSAYWNDGDSTIIAVAYYPYGDITTHYTLYNKEMDIKITSIDEQSMKEEVVKLITNIG